MNEEQNQKNNSDVIDLSQYRGGARTTSPQQIRPSSSSTAPRMVKGVIKLSGGRLNEKQANYLLLLLGITFLAIALILFINTIKGPSKPPKGLGGNAPSNLEEFEKSLYPSK